MCLLRGYCLHHSHDPSQHSTPLQELCYLSIKFVNEVVALIELTLKGRGVAQLAIKTVVPDIVAGIQQSMQQILASDSDA
jgi:AP-1 complex subunit beta-1